MSAASNIARVEAMRRDLGELLGGFAPSRFRIDARTDLPTTLPGTRGARLDLTRVDCADGTRVRVRAYLTGPAGAWHRLPAVLYCHAHGNRYDIGADELLIGRPALLQPPYAQDLAKAGCVALCIDLPCFGERAVDTESALAKAYLWQGRTLFGAMLNDLAGALTVLAAIDGVDAARVSAFGISMGATLAVWLAALDDRIGAVAQLCCFADLATLVSRGQHDLHGIYMTVPGLLPRYRTGEIAGLIAPRPQLIGIGLADPLTPPPAVELALADVTAAYATGDARSTLEVLLSASTGHKETAAMRAASLALASG